MLLCLFISLLIAVKAPHSSSLLHRLPQDIPQIVFESLTNDDLEEVMSVDRNLFYKQSISTLAQRTHELTLPQLISIDTKIHHLIRINPVNAPPPDIIPKFITEITQRRAIIDSYNSGESMLTFIPTADPDIITFKAANVEDDVLRTVIIHTQNGQIRLGVRPFPRISFIFLNQCIISWFKDITNSFLVDEVTEYRIEFRGSAQRRFRIEDIYTEPLINIVNAHLSNVKNLKIQGLGTIAGLASRGLLNAKSVKVFLDERTERSDNITNHNIAWPNEPFTFDLSLKERIALEFVKFEDYTNYEHTTFPQTVEIVAVTQKGKTIRTSSRLHPSYDDRDDFVYIDLLRKSVGVNAVIECILDPNDTDDDEVVQYQISFINHRNRVLVIEDYYEI